MSKYLYLFVTYYCGEVHVKAQKESVGYVVQMPAVSLFIYCFHE